MDRNFKFGNMSCADSIWGDLDFESNSQKTNYAVGSIVQINNGANKGLVGMIKSINSNKCNLSSLREKPNDFNSYFYSDLIENLKLVSKNPMTKEQYNNFYNQEIFVKPQETKYKNLVLKDISIFGNPCGELNLEGNFKYQLENKQGFVSFFSATEPKIIPYDNQFDTKNGGVLINSRYILPLEYKQSKNENQKFHSDESIDEFIKKSILDYIGKIEMSTIPF